MINQKGIMKSHLQKLIFPLCPQSPGAMAFVHPDPLGPACHCQLQWPLLRHRVALPNAPFCHRFHRCLPLEDESHFGCHYVCVVLCLPRPQHPTGEASHHLPGVHLTQRALTLQQSIGLIVWILNGHWRSDTLSLHRRFNQRDPAGA